MPANFTRAFVNAALNNFHDPIFFLVCPPFLFDLKTLVVAKTIKHGAVVVKSICYFNPINLVSGSLDQLLK